MKKLLAIATILFFVLAASGAWAAGTATPSLHMVSYNGNWMVIKLTCTGDVSDGSVPATQIVSTDSGFNKLRTDYWKLGYQLVEVLVDDGSPAPDAADIAITDETGVTIYSEANVIPTSGAKYGAVSYYRAVTTKLTVTVTNQATASAKYDIYLKLAR